MNKLTKPEMINILQENFKENNFEFSKKDTEAISDIVFNTILDKVEEDKIVPIQNFGMFRKKVIKGRTGTLAFGDKAGQEWTSEDKITLGFKPSSNIF